MIFGLVEVGLSDEFGASDRTPILLPDSMDQVVVLAKQSSCGRRIGGQIAMYEFDEFEKIPAALPSLMPDLTAVATIREELSGVVSALQPVLEVVTAPTTIHSRRTLMLCSVTFAILKHHSTS